MPKSFWRSFYDLGDALFQPLRFYSDLAASQDLGPAGWAVAITSGLFALSSLVSQARGLPLSAPPLFAWPAYRVVQAAAMPAVILGGCCLCASVGALLGRWLFGGRSSFQACLAACTPALLVPLWPMLWPTELAVSLGLLNSDLPGFPGLWVRDLAPALTVCYDLGVLTLAYWQVQRVLLREAFSLAVLSLLPAFGWWAVVLR